MPSTKSSRVGRRQRKKPRFTARCRQKTLRWRHDAQHRRYSGREPCRQQVRLIGQSSRRQPVLAPNRQWLRVVDRVQPTQTWCIKTWSNSPARRISSCLSSSACRRTVCDRSNSPGPAQSRHVLQVQQEAWILYAAPEDSWCNSVTDRDEALTYSPMAFHHARVPAAVTSTATTQAPVAVEHQSVASLLVPGG